MWEWNYAKEPFDLKLMILRLLKKIWIPALAALLGAAVVGGGYYVQKVVLGGPDQYEVTSTFYVEYGTDPQTGNQYTYINDASWKSWVLTDWFTDKIWEEALAAGMDPERFQIEKTDLPGFLTAALPTDLRMPTGTVRTPDADLTAALGNALEQAFIAFAGEQKEIDNIKVVDTAPVTVWDRDVRTLRACILGAVLFAFFTLLYMFVRFCTEDSIHIPETFTFRYGIPMLGAVTGSGPDMELTAGTAENITYVFRDKKKIAVTAVEPEADLQAAAHILPEASYVCVPGTKQEPEGAAELRDADGILLLVKAGARNGKAIEHMLHYLKIQDCWVDGALLYGADKRLLAAYCLPGIWGKSR